MGYAAGFRRVVAIVSPGHRRRLPIQAVALAVLAFLLAGCGEKTGLQTTVAGPPGAPCDATWEITGQIPYEGGYGHGKVCVYTSDRSGVIDRPIVVIDGFDPLDYRHWDTISYREYTPARHRGDSLYTILNKNGGIETSRAEFDLDWIVVDPSPAPNPIPGSDPGGGDYIQRNAFMLIEVLNRVNAEKEGDEPVIVLGPSMGGLIARYALAYMEHNGMTHNTGLFISWDAPHQGANVPIGNQYLVDFWATHPRSKKHPEDVHGFRESKGKLDSVAARQLLIYHYTDDVLGERPLRIQFQAELDALGYPLQSRNVAITNGSGDGLERFEAGWKMIHWVNAAGPSIRADCHTWTAREIEAHDAHAKLFHCSEAKIFGSEATGVEYVRRGMLRVDSAPGSTIETTALIAESDVKTAIGPIQNHLKPLPVPVDGQTREGETHVSTLSALDLPLSNEALFRPIPLGVTTPFDAIYVPSENEPHIDVNPGNLAFLFGEIERALGAGDHYVAANLDGRAGDEAVVLDRGGDGVGLLSGNRDGSMQTNWISQDWVNPPGQSGDVGWKVRQGDRLVAADLDGDALSELVVVSPDGAWIGIMHEDGGSLRMRFIGHAWVNPPGEVGPVGWKLHLGDQFLAADLDGDDQSEIVVVSPNGDYIGVLNQIDGELRLRFMTHEWVNPVGQSGPVGWKLSQGDRFFAAGLDEAAGDELVVVSSDGDWIGLLRWASGGLRVGWIGHEWVNPPGGGGDAGWRMHQGDQFLAADLDGDDQSEIVVVSPDGEWVGVLHEVDGALRVRSMVHAWVNPVGQSGEAGWNLHLGDQFLAADLDGDDRSEVVVVSPAGDYIGVLHEVEGTLRVRFMTRDWVNPVGQSGAVGWRLRLGDQFLAADVDGVAGDEVNVRSRNDEYIGVLQWHDESLRAVWIADEWPTPQAVGTTSVGLALFDADTGRWHLRANDGSTFDFYYGWPKDIPLMGDWDCDGVDTVAMYRRSTGFVYLRNSNDFGVADREFYFGAPRDIPLAGDWDGDGCDTFSVYRASEGRVYISNELGTRPADYSYYFGVPGDRPFSGDFDGDGVTSVGLYRQSTGETFLRNALSSGVAELDFYYGNPSDRILAGDWDGDGDETVGIFRPNDARFFLSNENALGVAEVELDFGESGWLPVCGFFDVPPPVNGLPTAVDDSGPQFNTVEDTAMVTGDVLGNDFDSDGNLEPMTIEIDASRTHGSVVSRWDGTFDFTPTDDFNGPTWFGYRAQDSGGAWSNWATVNILVAPVNDQPAFARGSDVTMLVNSGTHRSRWASLISTGPADEADQTGTFFVTGNTNPRLFSEAPTVSATGHLTFRPAPEMTGSADINVELRDDGGVLNGGINTSESVTFTITVVPPPGWAPWDSLEGTVGHDPVILVNLDGRLEAFVRGPDDALWHVWQIEGVGWSDWESLGGSVVSDPVVVVNHDGRVEVFVRGLDDALWHVWQIEGVGWSEWERLGGTLYHDPEVVVNHDGRLEVFVRGTEDALWHVWQIEGVGWSEWEDLGGSLASDPVILVNLDGRLEAFVRGPDDALWHVWQIEGLGWSDWESLGGSVVSDPVVVVNHDGRVEVFVRGLDDALWHVWQIEGVGWSEWERLGGTLYHDPEVVVNHDGRLEVFVRGTEDALWHVWQIEGVGWSEWEDLGGSLASDPVILVNLDGRLEAFVRGPDDALWHVWQIEGLGWSDWAQLGGATFSHAPIPVVNTDGRLEVFVRGINGALWHIWQEN